MRSRGHGCRSLRVPDFPRIVARKMGTSRQGIPAMPSRCLNLAFSILPVALWDCMGIQSGIIKALRDATRLPGAQGRGRWS